MKKKIFSLLIDSRQARRTILGETSVTQYSEIIPVGLPPKPTEDQTRRHTLPNMPKQPKVSHI